MALKPRYQTTGAGVILLFACFMLAVCPVVVRSEGTPDSGAVQTAPLQEVLSPERGMEAGWLDENGDLVPPGDDTGEDVNAQSVVKGVDVSYYSGNISVAQWRQIKANGWTAVVVQAWGGRGTNSRAVGQIGNARAAGIPAGAYCLLNYDNASQTGAWQVQQALAACGGQRRFLKFLAIDVETMKNERILVGVVARIQSAVDECRRHGVRPVIYASNSMWHTLAGTSTAFRSLPLWDAYYDGIASLTIDSGHAWRSYGGWPRRFGKQYRGDYKLFGIDVDLNVFDASLFQ